jgi:hypothetical protein
MLRKLDLDKLFMIVLMTLTAAAALTGTVMLLWLMTGTWNVS